MYIIIVITITVAIAITLTKTIARVARTAMIIIMSIRSSVSLYNQVV